MISTMWTLAPAGARGPVGLAVRTAACVVVSPVAERLRAVPATPAAERPDTCVPGIYARGIDVFVTPVIGAFGYARQDERTTTEHTTTEHNGTTLGIHSSGRPSS